MRLVLSSPRRRSWLAAATLALAAFVCLSAFGSAAHARPGQTTAVVPNGYYGVNKAATGEYLVFKVRNRKISDLAFQIRIACRASDEPREEERFFSSAAMPQPRLIPQNGRFHIEWEERSEGRRGRIGLTIKFGTRDVADISIYVPEEDGPPAEAEETKESCTGGSELHFRRGYEGPRF